MNIRSCCCSGSARFGLLALVVGLSLNAAACSSEESTPSTSSAATSSSATAPAKSAQAQVVELTRRAFDEQGIALDLGCVEELAGQLTDDDAVKLVASYPDGEANLSPAGRSLGTQILSCTDKSDLIDRLVTSISSKGTDEQCIRDVLEPLDITQLTGLLQIATDDPRMTEIVNQIAECSAQTSTS